MNTIDFSPFYRNTIGLDRFVSLLDNTLHSGTRTQSYPPYNIESIADDKYAITLAIAGFEEKELEIEVENSVLTVKGKRMKVENTSTFLHQGIANRSFCRTFSLAEYVEVSSAKLANGILTIDLVKNVPEAMLPKTIPIQSVTL